MNRHCGRRRRRAQRAYRLLVRLYPAAHRRAFGEEMVQAFGDHYRDAVEAGGGSRLRFWMAVLADAGASLLTEHAAELRARRRRSRRPRVGPRRRGVAGPGGPGPRRRRVRRPRYRRVVLRPRRRRIAVLVLLLPVVAAVLATGLAVGHFGPSALLSGLVVAAGLVFVIRPARRVPAGPRGDGPAPPGGAGVREPRRPLPMSPAGAAARPWPDARAG